MKPYITAFAATIILIMLLNLQLCLFAYQQHSQFNPILLAYLYILFTNCSMTMLTILALMSDIITFLITGVFGLTILFLVPTSWLSLTIKDDMYNKIVIPCCFIFLYAIFYNVLLKCFITHSINIGQLLWAIIQNCTVFLGLWWTLKQPFHD